MRRANILTGAIAVAVAAAPAFAAAARSGPNGPTHVAVIDDAADGAALPGRFEYIGTWQHVRGKFDGRSFGTSTRSTRLGDVAIVRFDGTRIRLYGVRGPSGGRAGVALDFVSTGAPVDFYAPTVTPHSLIYASGTLAPGVHTLSIAVWGLHDVRARSYYVNIDDAEVDVPSALIGRASADPPHER
jgi:hypothetical protein